MKKLFLGITTLSLSLFCSAPLWAAPVTPPKPAKNVETRIKITSQGGLVNEIEIRRAA